MPRAERHYTIPTAMLSTDISSAMRIDYVMVNGGIGIDKGWVIRDPEADIASDHYPIAADFRLSRPSS
jgi:endonuclease/exonuclease/phosphatase family metal-dependent hydrolase